MTCGAAPAVTLDTAMASAAVLRRTFSARLKQPAYADSLLASGAFGASILVMLHGGWSVSRPGPGSLGPAGVTLVGLSTLPLAGWRRSPLAKFVVTATANVALAAVVYPIGVPVGPAVALYVLAASRDEQSPSLWRMAVGAGALLLGYVVAAGVTEATLPTLEFLHAGLLWSVAWFAGERARLRREQIEELKREARRERLLAAAEERTRIARDLHDSAGHAVNVIALRAGAARLRHHQDPDRSLAALEAIEELARATAADIDSIVGALREPNATPGPVEAPPGIASLPTLVAQTRQAGLDLVEATAGTPRRLASTVDQGAYRILQEALTNASKHGTGAAHLDITFDDTAVRLRVSNPVANHTPTEPNGDGSGHGLVGIRERAALLGGTLDIEHHNGRFQIDVHLPYEAGPR